MIMEKIELEQKIVEMIKTVYDPEIPVNIYDLGLIYRIEVKEDNAVEMLCDLLGNEGGALEKVSECDRQHDGKHGFDGKPKRIHRCPFLLCDTVLSAW